MKDQKLRNWVLCALIAAVYATASLVLAPFSFANIQCRVSEALTLLPLLMPQAIIGVSLGCLITNAVGVFMGANILGYLDIFIGTLATFLAASLTYYFRNVKLFKLPIISILMPVLFNGVFIGAELAFVLSQNGFEWNLFFINATLVAMGELVAVVLGIPLIKSLEKVKFFNSK